MSRPETATDYSECLKQVTILGEAQDGSVRRIRARETHRSMWMTMRYTLAYVQDARRREVQWALDPTAENDLAALAGSWRFVPTPDGRTLAVYRIAGDGGRLVPQSLQAYFVRRHLPEFLGRVRDVTEAGYRGGASQGVPRR